MRAKTKTRRRTRGPSKEKRRTRGPTKIRKTELVRAAKSMLAAGLSVRSVEVDPVSGKFVMLIGQPTTENSDLDDWLMRKKDARPA
jgi:hypothetical protein